ncbi:MAG: hypothetical protein JSU70_17985 [Phycisphaerales bacterium]|nr:MAG: hypothetical protein JSU70_17985 [Phycisphaerales bacterium]
MDSVKVSYLLPLWLMGVVGSAQAGRLQICPEHSYYFRDGSRHVALVGVSDRAMFTIWENDKGFSWRKYLDDLSEHHLNYVRQDVLSWDALLAPVNYPAQFSNPAWPFARTGPGVAVDGKPKFDLTKFEQSYFNQRIKPFLREAAKRGIYVELTLFEGFRASRFRESLYADRNNINQLGLRYNEVTSDEVLNHPRLLAIQHGYVDKVLSETSRFGNVIYEIANETGGKRWVAHFVDYIQRHPTHPSRLASAGEQTTSFDPRTGANDIVVKHRGGGGLYATDADVRNHHMALLRLRVGKPICHNEYFLFANRSTDDVNLPRKMMWGDFTAGGHSNFFDFTFWRGTGRTLNEGQPSRCPPTEILCAGRHLVDFLTENEIEFWTMAPHDELAAVEGKGEPHVFTLARPGAEYICYVLGDGPVTVTLRPTQGPLSARWYDPKCGDFLATEQRIEAKDRCLFRSPQFEQDIVLYVRRSN